MKPIKLLTQSTELRRVVEQINLDVVDSYNTDADGVSARLLALEAVTPDIIVNKMLVAQVNSDFDIIYDNDGEIITDG
jgi:hypothetical protein